MQRTVRAVYYDGKIYPLEPIELQEGQEVLLEISNKKSEITFEQIQETGIVGIPILKFEETDDEHR